MVESGRQEKLRDPCDVTTSPGAPSVTVSLRSPMGWERRRANEIKRTITGFGLKGEELCQPSKLRNCPMQPQTKPWWWVLYIYGCESTPLPLSLPFVIFGLPTFSLPVPFLSHLRSEPWISYEATWTGNWIVLSGRQAGRLGSKWETNVKCLLTLLTDHPSHSSNLQLEVRSESCPNLVEPVRLGRLHVEEPNWGIKTWRVWGNRL